MDYRELMSHAPEDCKPTMVDSMQTLKEKYAKEHHKKVEELTEDDEKGIMAANGLCDLDFLD